MAREFAVDIERHTEDVVAAIKGMENNKAVGPEGVHVEMLRSNTRQTDRLLTEFWRTIGKTRIVPVSWLQGTVVPLYKRKGDQDNPKNSRPLTILSHIKKITEKAVVIELEKVIKTDKSQFGFQAGLKILRAALNVLAAIRTTAIFLAILDLAKAYDSIVKALLLLKLEITVDQNLANQILVFLLTVHERVAGDITNTDVIMRKGLTRGASSPALFKMYINDLPEYVRAALREEGKEIADLEPIRLVADDVVMPAKEERSLKIALNACHNWASENHLNWNPSKSQILDVHPTNAECEAVHLGGVQLQLTTKVD